jgi:transcriptional regulator with XRE-family HTH domain
MKGNVAFDDRMRALLAERGMSLRQLAKNLHYDVGHLSRVMNGHKRPSLELATRLDSALGADGDLVALVSEMPPEVAWPANVEDAHRLTMRLLACGPPKQSAEPEEAGVVGALALRWLVAPPDAIVERTEGWRRIDISDVRRLHAVRQQLKSFDDAYGGGTTFPMALTYLRGEVAPLLEGSFSDATGRSLLAAIAELVLDVGWMAYDDGSDQQLARRYMLHALRLAHAAENRPLGARILCALSHQALHLDRRHLAVDLARAARSGIAGEAAPKMTAMIAAMEACAQAAVGDTSLCTAALADAERALAQINSGDQNPPWLDFDEGGLWGHAARAHRDLAEVHSGERRSGLAKAASRYAEQSIALCHENHSRTRAQRHTILATAHLQLGDIEHASAIGGRILVDARKVHSGHVYAGVASLVEIIAPQASKAGSYFVDQARKFLAVSGPRARA